MRHLDLIIYFLCILDAFCNKNDDLEILQDAGIIKFKNTSLFPHIESLTETDHSSYSEAQNIPLSVQESIPNDLPMEYLLSEEIADVTNLTIIGVSTDWIYFSWTAPYSNNVNLNISYNVTSCHEQGCESTDVINNQFNATDLFVCTRYNFTVNVKYKSRESNGISITTQTSTDINKIEDIQKLEAAKVDNNYVQLMWDFSEKYVRCIRNYFVIQCIKDDCNQTTLTIPPLLTTYTAENLDPCTEYTFSVKVAANNVISNGVNISAKTGSPKPSEPRFPMAESGNFSLTINWQPPSEGALCIQHYRVTVNSHPKTMNTTNTSTTIPVTDPPILQSEKLGISKTNLTIAWSFPKGNNNCPITSVVTVCNYVKTDGHGYTLVNGQSEEPVQLVVPSPEVVIYTTVEELSPYTLYSCSAYTVSKAGQSAMSLSVNATTLEDIPSAPNLHVINITDTQFTLYWETPDYMAGQLYNFEIALNWEILFPIPDGCVVDKLNMDSITNLNESIFSYEYLQAKPFTKYEAKLRVKTGGGWGKYSALLIFRTNPGVPGPVTNFLYRIKESTDDQNVLDTILTWGLPCPLNGIIDMFNVSVYGTRNGYKPHVFTVGKRSISDASKNSIYTVNLKQLRGEYTYIFGVAVKVVGHNSFGPTVNCSSIPYPAGIPLLPDEEYIKDITIDPYKARRSTSSATILLPLFPNTNGEIRYYAIMVSEIGYNVALHARFDLENNPWPDVSSWEEAMLEDFCITYQATTPRWNPYPNYVVDYGHIKAVKYVLGEDTTCKEISSNTDKRVYCNGPLKPDTWYHIRMRAYTYGGYADSTVFVIKTNAELNIAIVIGTVFGILSLGILTTMMLLARKCSPRALLQRCLHSNMPGSPVPTPFNRKKFIAHCQQLIDNPGKLSNEFQLLQTLSVDLQMPANTACLQANRKKNRYSDILPYDFSRVKLEVIDNDSNTDYINASFIRGYTGEDEYIACQGPKEETTYDFWRMVDQYDINIIVMLTQLIEKGKEKCHQYFPTIRETFRYENMTIRCSSELDFRTYTRRTLVLQKDNKKKSIVHLHFKDWPDHDVPEDFDPTINFCQILRRNITSNKGFVIVHCSAGIGRTGTLIAIDILLQHLRDNRKLDVFGTVYRLRHHRINMVQRESQYAYIYNCIKQVLKNPYFLKSYKPPPVDPVHQSTISKASGSNTNLVNRHEACTCQNVPYSNRIYKSSKHILNTFH